MTDVVFVFEVHQPFRLKRDFFWENRVFKRARKDELFEYYFDQVVNKEVFLRACKKCYLPSNMILLETIDKFKREKKQAKFSFSISGVFLEQCEAFSKDLLETFRQLAKTGCVEFLSQTYFHSLASLYPDREEFVEQVKQHQQTLNDLIGYMPVVFENTELLYNNAVAKTVEKLGYKGIYTEGVERILHGKSPNYLYTPKDCKRIKILLRNYKLTDDIGFRFSARGWNEWPLTADKYASWLAGTSGNVINIFPDYETFGEHHWPETGIHDFLRHLPGEILKWWQLHMTTPSEVVDKYPSSGEIDVPELGGTVSWADLERDASCWLGNTMQWAYYTSLRKLEPFVKESGDKEFLKLWRYFQTSDHLYYMFTAGGAPGEVHSYFSHYNSPVDAFVTALSAILDFENRVRLATVTANEPFLFYTGEGKEDFTGVKAWSLNGLATAFKKIDPKTLEFHNARGDLEKWAEMSLQDRKMAEQFKRLKALKLKGEPLRKRMIQLVKNRHKELADEAREAAGYF